ncbi:MAG: IS630 transposase-related protein, partial [Cyanobacteria bacterium P01_E01_bin.34]
MSVLTLIPAAYSIDLRPKVLKAIERVEQKSHISRTFGISRNTIDLWPKQRDQTGSV